MHSYAITNPWLLLGEYCLQQQGPMQPRSQGSRQAARERNLRLNKVGSNAFFKSIKIPRENRRLTFWLVFIAECQIYDLSHTVLSKFFDRAGHPRKYNFKKSLLKLEKSDTCISLYWSIMIIICIMLFVGWNIHAIPWRGSGNLSPRRFFSSI